MTVVAVAPRRRRAAPAASLRIEAVDPLHPDALALLAQATEDLHRLYPALFGPGLPPPTNLPALPRSVYLVAYAGLELAGCAALHPLDALEAEVRRVFVPRGLRRRGVARTLMAHLEDHARALGYERLKLETGAGQSAALALYRRTGWQPIEPFGPYVHEPGCVCLQKRL